MNKIKNSGLCSFSDVLLSGTKKIKTKKKYDHVFPSLPLSHNYRVFSECAEMPKWEVNMGNAWKMS